MPNSSHARLWRLVYYTLFILFFVTAALNMLHIRGGVLTNHTADIIVPAWLYVVARGLHAPRARQPLLARTIGRTPATAALSLFVASTLTEVSQRYWPRGIFAGRFDPLDVAAFGAGLAACYAAEKLWPVERPSGL
jgi:hypothetical protein